MELDKTVKSKLESFPFDEQPSEESVNNLFARLDKELAEEQGDATDTAEGKVVTMQPEAAQPDARPEGTPGETKDTKTVQLNPMRWGLRIAAGLLLLLVAGFAALQVSNVSTYAARGQQATVTLPDGSTVTLNADSKLAYNKLTWGLNRKVSLEGEAFFEVEKGSTFAVNSPQGTTTVLGTSFNVYDRPDGFTVKCSTGKVKVAMTGEKAPVTLTPGEGVTTTEGSKRQMLAFEAATANTWIGGTIEFREKPFRYVVAAFERQFDVTVVLAPQSIGDALYTGFIDGNDRDVSLRLICVPMNLTFTEEGRTITITEARN